MPYLSLDEIAARLDVTKATVSRWFREADGPRHIRIGTTIRVTAEDFEAWLESKIRNSQAGAPHASELPAEETDNATAESDAPVMAHAAVSEY